MANDCCQRHGGSSVCLQGRCYKRAVRGGMCTEYKVKASLQAERACEVPIFPAKDPEYQVDKSPCRSSLSTIWQDNTINTTALCSHSYSECRYPTSRIAQHFGQHENTMQLAMAEHEDQCRYWQEATHATVDSTSSPTRQYHHSPGLKVHPVLPSFRSLLNYRTCALAIRTNDNVTTSEARREVDDGPLRLMSTTSTGFEHQDRNNSYTTVNARTTCKHNVHSRFYKQNDTSSLRSATRTTPVTPRNNV
uniref:Uncharacterized protein n=1 Tax=Peronospora matthiolae TaxID=2874970 RepID=A0AAV1TKY9_9STRA